MEIPWWCDAISINTLVCYEDGKVPETELIDFALALLVNKLQQWWNLNIKKNRHTGLSWICKLLQSKPTLLTFIVCVRGRYCDQWVNWDYTLYLVCLWKSRNNTNNEIIFWGRIKKYRDRILVLLYLLENLFQVIEQNGFRKKRLWLN